jgi:shikimate kinase
MSVVLIGYRGSGKSTVGRLLAARRGAAFVDTDEMIVESAGRSIREIFAASGEADFRKQETWAIELAVAEPGRVISVGGGAVEAEKNRRLLREYGVVVWLDAPAATLWRRIDNDPATASGRPDLGGGGEDEVRAVLARRNPLYAATADHRILVISGSPDNVVNDIELRLAAADTMR